MPKYALYAPPEFRYEQEFKNGQQAMQPMINYLAKNPPPMDFAHPYLTGILLSLAGPLLAYLGKEGGIKAAERLKECIDGAKEISDGGN